MFLDLFVCMSILSACVPVHHMYAWCAFGSEDGIEFPGTRVTGQCE